MRRTDSTPDRRAHDDELHDHNELQTDLSSARLLAADGEGDRLGRQRLHRDAHRPGVSPAPRRARNAATLTRLEQEVLQ
jgi:hypothetical protein